MRPAHGELAESGVDGGSNDRSKGLLRESGASTPLSARSGPFRSTAATWVLQAPRTSAAAGAPSRRQGREAGLRRPPRRRSRRTRSTGGRSRARVAPAPPLPPPRPDPAGPRPGASAAAVFEGAGGAAPRARIRRKIRVATLPESNTVWFHHIQVPQANFTSVPSRRNSSPVTVCPRALEILAGSMHSSLRSGSDGATTGLRKLKLEPLGLNPAA